jgi:hypothetical protein
MVFCHPKDKERLNIKNAVFMCFCLLYRLLCFLQIQTTVFMVSLLINESEAPRGIGISKLEGPVTYSTRSEFKVLVRQKAD